MLKRKSFFFLKKECLVLLAVILGIAFCGAAMAKGSGTGGDAVTLSALQSHIKTAVGATSQILMDIATISGVGFIFAAFFKFHQHKLNPTQVPLSQGVTLLLIGAGLAVFPHLLSTTSVGIFGTPLSRAGSTKIIGIVTS